MKPVAMEHAVIWGAAVAAAVLGVKHVAAETCVVQVNVAEVLALVQATYVAMVNYALTLWFVVKLNQLEVEIARQVQHAELPGNVVNL